MKVGSLVECVKTINNFYYGRKYLIMPVLKKTYIVSGIGVYENGEPCIFVDEIEIATIKYGGEICEIGFKMSWFKELQPPIANIEEHINENTLEPVYI